MAMQTSSRGLSLIKRFEGFRPLAYKCPAGVWTIGYGHTHRVRAGQACTDEQADLWLVSDVMLSEAAVDEGRVFSLNQNEFDALVSFVFNVGAGAWRQSTMRSLLQAGKPRAEVAKQFLRWNKVKGKDGKMRPLEGLTRRRIAEQALFMDPVK